MKKRIHTYHLLDVSKKSLVINGKYWQKKKKNKKKKKEKIKKSEKLLHRW